MKGATKLIGLTLKKFRKDKNIPIMLICDGIMDSGNYWRLENEKINSSFSTVLKLLERMNVSIEEFTEEFDIGNNVYKSYEIALVSAFKQKNTKDLKLLKQKISSDLADQKTMKLTNLYYLVDIYISKIDKTWDSKEGKLHIKNYLSKCNNWNSYELTLLNNVLFIYELDISFLFYKMAINKISNININQEKIILLTLNTMSLCIENDEKDKLIYLLSVLDKIKLEEKETYGLITQQWGRFIGQYYLFNNPKYLLEAENIVNIFKTIGMDDTYNLYYSWTNSYKNIIKKK